MTYERQPLVTQPLCPACTSGPSEIQGHPRLLTLTIGGGLFSLRCQDCQALWKRTSVDGLYKWELITDAAAHDGQMGMFVPPRSTGPTTSPERPLMPRTKLTR